MTVGVSPVVPRDPPVKKVLGRGIGCSTREKAWRVPAVWLLALLWHLPAAERIYSADAGVPTVVGELSERVGAADIQAMCALAQPLLPAPAGQPILIKTSGTSSKDSAPTMWHAIVYFAPREVSPSAWRGFSVDCYWEAALYPQDEHNRRRVVDGWSVGVSEKIGEYLVLRAPDQPLPLRPPEDCAHFDYIRLSTELDTARVLGLIETARGYSMMVRDGSELPFGNLRITNVYSRADESGQIQGTVTFVPPASKALSRFPFHVAARTRGKRDWHIVKVDQMVYY